jgi:polyphenol oxidase
LFLGLIKMHTWQWQTWNELPYLTCSLLEGFPHGFFTQQFWLRPPSELTSILDPNASTYRLKQIHGNIVLTPQEIAAKLQMGGDEVEGDGVKSDDSQQGVWVASADCTPVLIADVKTGQVAAVHAGWKGTAKKIVPVAVGKMLDAGSRIADLRVAMGPAIAGEVYQVSRETAAEVGATISDETEPEKIVETLMELANSPILPDSIPDRVRLDVRRVNGMQLASLGMGYEQIAIASYCTFQTPEYFFSYRREKAKKIQWSGIVSL